MNCLAVFANQPIVQAALSNLLGAKVCYFIIIGQVTRVSLSSIILVKWSPEYLSISVIIEIIINQV